MKPRRRKLLLWFALLLLAVGLLAFGFFPQEPLRSLLESRLRAALGPNVRVARLHIVPGLLRAEVDELHIRSAALDLDLPRARVQLSLATFIGAGLSIESLEVETPHLVVHVTPAGASGAAAPLATTFVLRRLALHDGQVVYETASGKLTVSGLQANGGLGSGALALSAASAEWNAGDSVVQLGPIDAGVQVSPALELTLQRFAVRTEASHLDLTGALGSPWKPRLDLTVAGRIAFADVAPIAHLEGFAGNLDLNARVQGAPAEAALQLSVKGETLQLAGWPVERLAAELTRAAGPSGALALRADGQALGGRVEASGTVAGATLRDGRIDAHGIDAEALRRRFAPTMDALPGRVALQARFHGALAGALATSVKANVELQAVAQAIVAQLDVEGTLRPKTQAIDARFTLGVQSSALAPTGLLRGMTLESTGQIQGSTAPRVNADWHAAIDLGSAGQAPLRGHVESDGAQWHAGMEGEPLGGHLTATASATGTAFARLELQATELQMAPLAKDARGTLALTLDAHGPMAALDGTLSARGAELALPSANIGTLTVDGQLHQGQASLDIAAPDLAATATGLVDMQRAALDLKVQDLPLERLTALASAQVSGTLTAQARIDLPFDGQHHPGVEGQVTSMELRHAPWSAHSDGPFAFRLRDERIQLDPATLSGSGVELKVEGQADLRADTLTAHPQLRIDLAGLPPVPGWTATGHVAADVSLSGAVTRPSAEGALTSQNVELQAPGWAPVRVDDGRIEVHGTAVEIPGLVARAAGGSATLQGRLPLAALVPAWRARPARVAADEAAALRLEWKDVDAARLRAQPEEPAEEPAPDATPLAPSLLSGVAVVNGGLASLTEPTAQLTTPAWTLALGGTTLTSSPLDLRLEAGRVSGSPVELQTPNAKLALEGTVDLARRDVQATARGAVELRALSAFLSETAFTGVAEVDVELHGDLDAPKPTGSLKIEDGSVRVRTLGQAVTGLRTTLTFEAGVLRVERGEGQLGGGTLGISGQARLHGRSLSELDLAFTAREVGLRYPVGLRTRLNADLWLAGKQGALTLGGDVEALRADYDLDAVLDASLFSRRTAQAAPSELLRSIAFDLGVRVPNPARVSSRRNGFKEVTARGNLRFEGTLETPLPYGQLQLAAGGRVQLLGEEFRIASGELKYDGTWDAGVSLQADIVRPVELTEEDARNCNSEAGGTSRNTRVPISASLTGTLALPELAFASPDFSKDDALSLVANHKCGSEAARASGDMASGQLSSILAERLTSGLFGGFLALDEVTIQPSLLAKDENPGARFTFGKRINSLTRLVYSTSLNEPEDKYVRFDLGPWHTFTGSAKRFGTGEYEGTLGQRLEWGGPKDASGPARDERVRVREVVLEGQFVLPETRVREELDVRAGQRLTPWQLLDRADELRAWLRAQSYLEAEAGARFDGDVARVQVRSGPRYSWRVEGASLPGGFDDLMRSSLFEDEALDRGRERLLRDLRRDGYLRAEVLTRVDVQEQERALVFNVRRGRLVDLLPSTIDGARVLSPGDLLKLAGGERAAAAEPEAARERWRAAYRERYYLSVRVDGPRLVASTGGLRLSARVEEGPAATIAEVVFDGAKLDPSRLQAAAALAVGTPMDESAVSAATLRLRNLYLTLGYPKVRVVPSILPREPDVVVRFRIVEGALTLLREVRIEGAQHTRTRVLRGRTGLVPGKPLDPRDVVAAERRLLSLGTLAGVTSTIGEDGVVTLRVREAPRYLASYDLSYDDEGRHADVDGEVRNILGLGLVLGGRYGRGDVSDEARGFVNLPLRRGLFTLAFSKLSEDLPSDEQAGNNTRVQQELSAQQTIELSRFWKVLAGYRFKRVTVAPAFPAPVDTAGLLPSLIRDTRDNQLDTRSGRFYSLGLELDVKPLGGQYSFVKGLLQARVFSTHGAFTWGQGYQLGLSGGLSGGVIPATDRFTAGGPNSVRGYAIDALGPLDFFGDPAGGEAVLVLNQELRWRHKIGLGAAVFYDGGEVYATVGDFNLRLRHTLGFGLRYASPIGLVRLDLAVPLNPREGDKSYRWVFGLGQAF